MIKESKTQGENSDAIPLTLANYVETIAAPRRPIGEITIKRELAGVMYEYWCELDKAAANPQNSASIKGERGRGYTGRDGE